MDFPENVRYTKEHEWVRLSEDSVNGAQIAYIGITDFAQSELGEIVYVEVDTVGEQVARDDVFGTIEAVKTTSELYMPVSGKVVEFNPAIDEDEGDEPGLINSDPYGDGWIVKVEVEDPSEIEDLMDFEAYKAVVQ